MVKEIINSIYPLSNNAMEKIESLIETEFYDKRETFIRKGQRNTKEYFVIEGVCRSYLLDPEGQERKGEVEAEACEEIVANSGLNYTLVRASWFNQNFSEGAFLDFVLAGQVALPMPEAEIPFVDADDIAEVVTQVLVDDSYNGETITVTGPEKLTFRQVVKMMGRATGREIEYIPISIDEFKAGMKAAGLPDSYVWLFGYLFEEVLGNADNQVISNDFERVIGRKATSFEKYAQKTVATGIWSQAIIQ